ncbi:MAG: mscL [Candidatus Saccharibacteria bacterium]|nr:mscL [Candidatus Saccharibacteria bacterium]
MFRDFKKFILRGNTVDLAVAVVVGGAFSGIVTALVRDIITPIIAAVGGQPDFSKLVFKINGSAFLYGDFINAVVSFLIIASVIFFFVVQPVNKLMSRAARTKTTPEPATRKCPECFSEVPKQASRCAFCTAKISPVTS